MYEFRKINKNLKINKVKSGTKAFDWKVPLEWNVKQAYIIDPEGKKICDFKTICILWVIQYQKKII